MDFKGKKYLVTGGTGFIGSALVHRLVKEGSKVRVFDNDSRGSFFRLSDIKDNLEFIFGDIRNYNDVKNACRDCNSIIHLAYVNGTGNFYTKPELVLEIGVKGILNILDAAIDNNIKELIVASSSEVYQTPSIIPTPEDIQLTVPDVQNPRYSYGGGKIITELLALNYGRKFFDRVLIFRPHNVYGPDMGDGHVIPQLILKALDKTKQFEIQGTGNETRSFIYIDDFIDGLIKVMENGERNNIYNIGTENEISIRNLALIILQYFDRKDNIKNTDLTLGSTKRRCPDIAKLRKIGFAPKVLLKDGLKKTIEWYISNKK